LQTSEGKLDILSRGFAYRVGITRGQYSRYGGGKYYILYKILKFHKISFEDFLEKDFKN